MIVDHDVCERVLDRWDGTWADLFRVLDDPRSTLRDLAAEVRRLQALLPTQDEREGLRQVFNGQAGAVRRSAARHALARLGVL